MMKQSLKRRMDLPESIRNQTDVALNIAKKLFTEQDNNLVFSPVSVQFLLSIIGAGSKGSTRDEVLSFLRFESISDLNYFASQLVADVLSDGSPAGGPCLSFANGVWVQQSLPLKHSFKKLLHKKYKATLASADFKNKADGVRNAVNSWVEKRTNSLIKEVLPPQSVNCLTRLICANALYFEGEWNEKFDKSITNDFHLLNGNLVKVPFMISRKKQFISVFEGFKVLGLPYKQGNDKHRYSMYLFLPDAQDGLSALVEKMCSTSGLLERKLPHKKVEVHDFRIPRFKISFAFEISNVLKELGLVLPFLEDEADLTGMVDSPVDQNLHVSKIFHKSFIEVNEKGTKAAAASAATIRYKCMRFPMAGIDFVADHPFLFLIREDMSGAILFIGQVLNPLAG